ncbi:DUF3800 domain-containing protein [Mucilaginibacter agri]|uniref:DUF3800 domain-containing protein n=1 Tax=Mucilaginibacter agri TaxID=2695265 RepID=A0A965ZE63_9SPHI|nr:DUF3800 domain-containing protein [Mucilaginibacter agri]NCD69195.1 DUF3800 domain-containing protein [Mucilaginibacter agri]
METPNLNEELNSFDENSHQDELNEKQLAKLQRIEEEKKVLSNNIASGNIENIKDKVASILNNSIDARNSDIELAWAYWGNFESDNFNGTDITKENLFKLTKLSSLSRIRAKIQNEYKMFQADEKVRKYRGVLEEKNRQDAISDKPKGLATYSVYIDETGKTQEFLSVGSMWVLKRFKEEARYQLTKWVKDQNLNYEFHFKDIKSNRVNIYKEFFIKFLALFPEVSFKIIVLKNKGLSDVNSAILHLTNHLLIKGVNDENESGRGPLPRLLQAWIDEDESGSDQLKIENIKERINSQKIEGLYVGDFIAVSSAKNLYIQVVDLFTGSINRKLNTPDGTGAKDEFAEFLLNAIKFDLKKIDKNNSNADNSTVFNLTANSQ